MKTYRVMLRKTWTKKKQTPGQSENTMQKCQNCVVGRRINELETTEQQGNVEPVRVRLKTEIYTMMIILIEEE